MNHIFKHLYSLIRDNGMSIVKETFMDVKIFHENVTKKEIVF